MSILTPFEFAKYTEPREEMIGCFLKDNKVRNSSSIGNFSIYAFYGLIYGFALFLFNLYSSELYGSDKSLNAVILIITMLIIPTLVIYISINSYRNKNNSIDWKTGIIIGCIIGVISAIISSAMSYIYFNFINPGALDNYLNNIYQGFDNEYIEKGKEIYNQNQLMNLFLSIPLGLLSGAILSLLPTYLLKSNLQTGS